MSVFVSVRRFGEDSTDICLGVVRQMCLMHAYSLVSLVSTCNATVNAECVTNGVVRFLVCCATFALSVGLLFSTQSCFFFGSHLFERLVTNFSF